MKQRLLLTDSHEVSELMDLLTQDNLTDSDDSNRDGSDDDGDVEIGPANKRKKFYIAGVDISFVKGDNVNACAALVVLNFPKLQVNSIRMYFWAQLFKAWLA